MSDDEVTTSGVSKEENKGNFPVKEEDIDVLEVEEFVSHEVVVNE